MKFRMALLLKGDAGCLEGDGALIHFSKGCDFLVRLAPDICWLLRVGSVGCCSSAISHPTTAAATTPAL